MRSLSRTSQLLVALPGVAYYPTCASVASAWDSQKVISIA
jgi:hypothetical protein